MEERKIIQITAISNGDILALASDGTIWRGQDLGRGGLEWGRESGPFEAGKNESSRT